MTIAGYTVILGSSRLLEPVWGQLEFGIFFGTSFDNLESIISYHKVGCLFPDAHFVRFPHGAVWGRRPELQIQPKTLSGQWYFQWSLQKLFSGQWVFQWETTQTLKVVCHQIQWFQWRLIWITDESLISFVIATGNYHFRVQ